MRLAPEWTPKRQQDTNLENTYSGHIKPEGRLWDFIEAIAMSRREGKNRRDGATVSTRVLALADVIGQSLFDSTGGKATVDEQENRRKAGKRGKMVQARAHL